MYITSFIYFIYLSPLLLVLVLSLNGRLWNLWPWFHDCSLEEQLDAIQIRWFTDICCRGIFFIFFGQPLASVSRQPPKPFSWQSKQHFHSTCLLGNCCHTQQAFKLQSSQEGCESNKMFFSWYTSVIPHNSSSSSSSLPSSPSSLLLLSLSFSTSAVTVVSVLGPQILILF